MPCNEHSSPKQLFIYWAVIYASTIVGTLFIHTECIPCSRAEDTVILNIVHTHRNTEYRTKSDEVGTNMSVGNRTMICAPAVHHRIDILERRFV